MNKEDLLNICDLLTTVSSLKVLNVSGNGLTQADLIPMFEVLHPQSYQLTHLSLAWNPLHDDGGGYDP